MHIYTPDMVLGDLIRMSESSQNSATQVNLILDQCLQNKAFERV